MLSKIRLLGCRGCFQLNVRYNHMFKNKLPNNSFELSKYLLDKAIYKNNGLIVLNKPYGISFSSETHRPAKSKDQDFEITLNSMLPYLKDLNGSETFSSVKVPEKFTSGVAIFCTDEALVGKIKKQLTIMRNNGNPSDTYLAVVLGHPRKKRDEFIGAITLEERGNTKQKKAILISEWSRNALKKSLVKRVVLKHRVLSCNQDSALVEVSSTRNKWHCVRVYLSSQQLSPVLGDNLLGSRVKQVLGVSVPIDIFSQAASLPQAIPNSVLSDLELISRKDVIIPLHLHLSKIVIENCSEKGEHLEFRAPVPDFFHWTCSKLGFVDEDLLTRLTI